MNIQVQDKTVHVELDQIVDYEQLEAWMVEIKAVSLEGMEKVSVSYKLEKLNYWMLQGLLVWKKTVTDAGSQFTLDLAMEQDQIDLFNKCALDALFEA